VHKSGRGSVALARPVRGAGPGVEGRSIGFLRGKGPAESDNVVIEPTPDPTSLIRPILRPRPVYEAVWGQIGHEPPPPL
jgi:hypothetical protein